MLQVLVLDLDGTLVTAEAHDQDAFKSCQHAVELHLQHSDEPWFCVPRAGLVKFFLKLIWRYHIMFCTAGRGDYAETVVQKLRETLLGNVDLDQKQRDRITEVVSRR